MAEFWLRHGEVLLFQGEQVSAANVRKRFNLDESAEIRICGETVAGCVSVEALQKLCVPGQDGKSRDSAFVVRSSKMFYVRCGRNCKKFVVDGVIDLYRICNGFRLDPEAGVDFADTYIEPSPEGFTCRPDMVSTDTQDGKSEHTAFMVSGEPVKQAEPPRIAKRFKQAYDVRRPSAETKDLQEYVKCTNRKYFNDLRTGKGMPIDIAVSAFARFRDNRKARKFKEHDLNFASELVRTMPIVYKDEAARRIAFVSILRCYLGDGYTVLDNEEKLLLKRTNSIDCGHHWKTPDIQILKEIKGASVKLCTVEVKPEMGMNGEPLTEAMFYYTVDAAHNFIRDRYTGGPQLVIEIVGPNIRVGGAVYHEKATYEPLTDFISLLPSRRRGKMPKFATLGVALRKALDDLTSLYETAPLVEEYNEDDVQKDPSCWPYAIRERYFSATAVRRARDGVEVYFVYRRSGTRVVKFVQGYGEEAHRQWEDLGYAPKHSLHNLPGGWLMVDMECLLPADGWRSLFDLRKDALERRFFDWERVSEIAVDTLKMLQRQQPLMVHGDLRLNNIMFNVHTYKICLVDFDWAGRAGTARYPIKMNAKINWPDGATPLRLIQPEHDMEMLEAELQLRPELLFLVPATSSSSD